MRVAFLRRKTFWLVIVLGISFLYPLENTIVRAQNVRVVTEEWRPIQGCSVRQSWQDYSLESRGHEQDLTTDPNGRVTFPRRTIRASLARRLLHPVWNVLSQGVHASFGVHTNIVPGGEVTEKPVGYKAVEARPGDVVFRLR